MAYTKKPKLAIVVPCYNESAVLPKTIPLFLQKINDLHKRAIISGASSIIFVDDGSNDATWSIIVDTVNDNKSCCGLRLSSNCGHQNALLAGMMESRRMGCDAVITIDCDGQDDIDVIDNMLTLYSQGYDIVYGVRADRHADSLFKRLSAQLFYRLMSLLGVHTVYNHADYRLVSKRVLEVFSDFTEVNLYLRGIFPLIGFKSTVVRYHRNDRLSGRSHYPLNRMMALAISGVTNFTIRPIHIVAAIGVVLSTVSLIMLVWILTVFLAGKSVAGWASTNALLCLFSGVQLISIGIVGEYVGKTYLETKHRPRYIIGDRVGETKSASRHSGASGKKE